MRVLHVIPAVAARYGGPSVVAVESVRALRTAGVDARIATTNADADTRLAIETGRWGDWQGVPTLAWPVGGGERFKRSAPLARWLETHVGDFDIVDVHAVFSHSSIAAGRACRRRGVPYVVRPHGALDPWSLSRHRWQKRLLIQFGVKRLLAGATLIQYTTRDERAGAERALPWLPPGRVVPLGIRDECFVEAATDVESPFVLTMSRLEAKKSLELLIDAFHEAASEALVHWRLVIAGDGAPDYVSTLEARAKAGPAAPRILFAGWVDGEAKRRLLSRASLFASPSTQENFGLSLVEAMAAGVPTLATPGVNLSGDIRQQGAGWVVDRTAAALVDALRTVLADAGERAARGKAARRLAERFTWDRSATDAIGLYESVLASGQVVRHV